MVDMTTPVVTLESQIMTPFSLPNDWIYAYSQDPHHTLFEENLSENYASFIKLAWRNEFE